MGTRASHILAIVFLLVSVPATVQAQDSGVIEGQVLNATSGGVHVGGVSVTLWTLDAQEQDILLQATTDGEGRFRFQGLDTQAYSYQVQAEYQAVAYWSDVLAFSEGEDLLSLTVEVYDSTTSDADLWVERAHLILDFQAGTIQAQELQIFVNGGSETYVSSGGEEGETVRFRLPRDAVGLQMAEGLMACCIVETAEGFAYTRPVLPGAKEFFFSYELMYGSDRYTLAKDVTYPIRHLDVMVADSGVEVTGLGLVAGEPVSLQDRRYQHLSAENLAPGDALTLHFASLPVEGRPSEPSTTVSPVLVRAVIGVGTLATILALGYPFVKKRQGE